MLYDLACFLAGVNLADLSGQLIDCFCSIESAVAYSVISVPLAPSVGCIVWSHQREGHVTSHSASYLILFGG